MSIVSGSVVEVKLSRGLVAIIDAEDAERVCQFKWTGRPGVNTNYAYRCIGYPKRKTVMLHRFILDAPPKVDVDHINGDGLDNRKSNLRLCNRSQNVANSRKPRKEGGCHSVFKGVYWVKQCQRNRRWKASLKINGKEHSRYFTTELAAARAYDELAREHFGEFAKTNFP